MLLLVKAHLQCEVSTCNTSDVQQHQFSSSKSKFGLKDELSNVYPLVCLKAAAAFIIQQLCCSGKEEEVLGGGITVLALEEGNSSSRGAATTRRGGKAAVASLHSLKSLCALQHSLCLCTLWEHSPPPPTPPPPPPPPRRSDLVVASAGNLSLGLIAREGSNEVRRVGGSSTFKLQGLRGQGTRRRLQHSQSFGGGGRGCDRPVVSPL